ncbi:DUF3159 domain-containing protein, partial [Micromonospora sp. STR1s_6]|nr:DUF3159 domain-containing protein [Micromonospora tarensis]
MDATPERDNGQAEPGAQRRTGAGADPGGPARAESLTDLVGGRRGAVDATVP